MVRKNYLFAAAPLALAGLVTLPASIDAAEIKTRAPSGSTIPRIKTPVPVKIEDNGRIRTVVTAPEEEASSDEAEQDPVATQEAQGTSRNRIRVGVPKVDTSEPVKVDKIPKIRTRIATPTEEEAEPEEKKSRTRVGVPRVDTSTPAEVENTPRIRTKIPMPVERDVPTISGGEEEPAAPKRVRIGAPHVDTSTPAEVESTPRIRTRVATPADDEEQAPPTRTRIAKPGVDGAVRGSLPGTGSIHSVDSAQANCLFRPARNLDPLNKKPLVPGSTAFLDMVCIKAGKPMLTTFRYDVPTEKGKRAAVYEAKSNDDNELSSIITYEIEPVGTYATGRPVYNLLSVERGDRGRIATACISPGGLPSSASAEDDAGSIHKKWCTDGKTISQKSLQMNRWLEAAHATGVSISVGETSTVKTVPTNIYSLSYEGATGVDESGPFLVRPGGGLGSTEARWDCRLWSPDAGSLYCTSDPVKGIVTTYLAYSMPEVRQAIGPMPAVKCETVIEPVFDANQISYKGTGGTLGHFTRYYDYKTVTCDTPKIAYRLLPGMVQPQDRAQTMGACYLAAAAGIDIVRVVKITYSKAVEATDTGQDAVILTTNGEGKTVRVISEGKVIGTSGSIDPDTTLNGNGKRVPKENITKVNAPCL